MVVAAFRYFNDRMSLILILLVESNGLMNSNCNWQQMTNFQRLHLYLIMVVRYITITFGEHWTQISKVDMEKQLLRTSIVQDTKNSEYALVYELLVSTSHKHVYLVL